MVSLRAITCDNVRQVCSLQLAPGQEEFIAPNSWSIAEAYPEPHAWLRAIYADEQVVGLASLHWDESGFHLWRFMIGADFQHQGYGSEAIGLLKAQVRHFGGDHLKVNYLPGNGSPGAFYRKQGFMPTGEIDDDEIVMDCDLLPVLVPAGSHPTMVS